MQIKILKIVLGCLLAAGAGFLAWPNAIIAFIFWALIIFLIVWPKIFLRFFVGVLAFILLVWLLIQTSPVQNYIAGKVATKLSKDLNTTVKIGSVDLSLFDKMDLNNTLILDQHKDTLLKAGSLKLRITDWFFLKNNIELKYIGLEDAVINQQRTDSVWNYQFLIDHFTKPKKSKKHSKNIVLKIQKIDLKNVVYNKYDGWNGQHTVLKTGSFLLDADNIDITKNLILINSIDIDKTSYTIEKFDGKNPVITKSQKDSGLYLNPSNLLIKIASLKLTNCNFGVGTKGEVPRKNVFDGKHIEVSKINGDITDFNFTKDTIKANINLSAVERSGVKIKKIKTAFRLTPHIMEFAKLQLQTNNSSLNNYYAMQYKDLNTDMQSFITNVTIKAVFRNSIVFTNDVAYFAPGLKTWNEKFLVNGKFSGTVSDFNVKDLFLRNSNNTFVSGDLNVKGLPQTDKTIITLNKANIQTNSREIAGLVPSISTIKSPDLAALGNVHFVGDFTGTIHSVNAKGALSSSLGGMYTDLILSFPTKAQPSYKGSVETQQFNLGKFLSVPNLGNVSFKGDVEGSSFQLGKISTRLNGTFNSLTYKDYTYSNLAFNGEIKHKNFKGDFKSEDPNFIFTSNIVVDLSGDVPSFNVLGDLVTANLKSLKLSKDSVAITGLFDLDFRGHNIDDFLGYAKILNASVIHNNQRLDFDSLTLSASLDSLNQKKLMLQSNEFVVSVEGQYKILQLPQSFQSFLHHYYPSYINPPKTELSNQNFVASISTGDFDRYAKLIDSNLSGFNNAFLSGKISTLNGDKFNLNINIPSGKYKRDSVADAKFTGIGDNDSLVLEGDIGKIYVSDSMYFPNTKILIHSANDLSHVKISTRANATLNDAELDADVQTMKEGLKINFHPSSFVLNDKKWNLENQGEVVIAKHSASAKNMKFTQGFQEISIESVNDSSSTSNTLAVRLKDVDFGDIIPLVVQKPLMEGIVNGNIYLRDIYSQFHADADLHLKQFRLNNDSIGLVDVGAKYNSADGKILYNINANDLNFIAKINGSYNTKDSTHNPLQTEIKLDHAKVGILNTFLGTLFDDITGLATGTLAIHGDLKNMHLTGQAHLDSGALTVKYTKVRYTIPSADFVLTEDGINFGSFNVVDKFGNTGNVKGMMYETAFKNNRYDIDMSTNKLLLFDTKAKDNDHFYGDVIGKATLSLKGPQENLQMNVTGEAVETSHIYIPTDASKKSADADYIFFKQYGTQPQTDTIANTTNLNINLDLTANNKAIVSVILDELTGDIIQATGNGRLLIKIPALGDVTMNGRYNIEQGNYNFNFQSLVKKPFELLPGQNSYIEWNGDPFDATIKITAQYIAKNVSLSDLISSTPFTDPTGAATGYRGDVYVIADLSGKLSHPDIRFHIDFPQGTPIHNDEYFNRLMAKIESDQNEMLKQVTWLIVFDAFSPYGEIAGNSTFVQAAGINTISQKVASVLNAAVSDLLYKLTGDKSLQFDVGAKTYSSYSLNGTTSGSTLDRTAVDLKLNKSLLNNKVIVTFGGDLDFGVSGAAAATSNNFQWLPDISVQIILSKDKKLRAVIFNHSSLATTAGSGAGSIGRVTKQGVSISYTKDFDKFFGGTEDIYFEPPKQRQPKDSLSAPQKGKK